MDMKFLRAYVDGIDKRPDGCWVWNGHINSDGYGTWNNSLVHRTVAEMFIAPIPNSSVVCHTCDVPSCVNPAHLWIGTQAENQEDKAAKGRAASKRGSRNPQARITEEIAQTIKYGGMRGADAARTYGVSPSMVCDIRKGRTWAHV